MSQQNHTTEAAPGTNNRLVSKSNPLERFNFPEEEEKILKMWQETNAFQRSLEVSKERPPFVFFDGPPFATGLPHYGHILAGTIKDVVIRYATMKGHYVERRNGWDCHGLPVEYEIDKKLGIKTKDDVMKMGIPAYNAECRGIVQRYTDDWKKTIERMGRWIDFENNWKTMDPEYMESVWWVFSELFKKGQIYRGFRVMPYSSACMTPLSNFELALNYKDVNDPSVMLLMPIKGDAEGASLVVWTTTPWTLPTNFGVAVHPDLDYVYARDAKTGKTLVCAEARMDFVFPAGSEVTVLKKVKGSDLSGLEYEPLFSFYGSRKEQFPLQWTVVAANFVAADSGTGLVHLASFGQEDFEVMMRVGIFSESDVPCPVDEAGLFKEPVSTYAGQYWKDANTPIMRDLTAAGRVWSQSQVMHSYPFCWRSDTPLIYRPIACWFVRVTEIIPQLLESVAGSNWVPEFVKEKRFHNWLCTAPDWAISRNRYWGTPLPIWASADMEEVVCIGSVAELEELSGVTGIKDLHRESIDHITIPSKKGKGELRRIEEVLDCWFESGCVPYGKEHYPFKGKEYFDEHFPADFIGEGLDQTRGWFYTLMVIGTHLFGRAPFKNVIVNGIVMAADGKKMSKRLKNYPEPGLIFDKYGADALRLYLTNSPVVRAETLKFKEEGVKNIIRDVLLPWYNAFRFLEGGLIAYAEAHGEAFRFNPAEPLARHENVMDAWILASLQTLIRSVRTEMDGYRLYTVVPQLLRFIEALTNWYIRFNRRRLKGEYGREEQDVSLRVLFATLYNFSLIMAPFTPFFAENLYQRLLPSVVTDAAIDSRSVHFLLYPTVNEALFDDDIERAFARLQDVVERVRVIRENKCIALKTPLRQVIVVAGDKQLCDDLDRLRAYILDELNVLDVVLSTDEAAYGIVYKATPNFKELGVRLKKDFVAVQAALKNLTQPQLAEFMATGSVTVCGHVLSASDIEVVRAVAPSEATSAFEVSCAPAYAVLLDTKIDAALREAGLGRELVNRVQRLRKRIGVKPTDEIALSLALLKDPENELERVVTLQADNLANNLRTKITVVKATAAAAQPEDEDVTEIGNGLMRLVLN